MSMTMAKPGPGQLEAVNEFMSMLEGIFEEGVYPNDTPVEGEREAFEFISEEWPKVEMCWQRVLFAGQVAIDNACDPDASSLEFKPEIATAIEQLPRLTAALHAARAHPDFSFVTVPADRGGMTMNGFERCPEAETASNWCPGDECWRRKKE